MQQNKRSEVRVHLMTTHQCYLTIYSGKVCYLYLPRAWPFQEVEGQLPPMSQDASATVHRMAESGSSCLVMPIATSSIT